MSATGRNALDSPIAYYPSRLAVTDPDAYFHVIAVNKGYDPLNDHLNGKGIHATCCPDVSDIAIVKNSDTATTNDKLSVILAYLVKHRAQGPSSTKTLATSVAALFQPRLDNDQVQPLLGELERNGVFVVDAGRWSIRYPTERRRGTDCRPPWGSLRCP